MRLLLALPALLVLATPVHAEAAAFIASVPPTDPEVGSNLHVARAMVGYLDANGNGRIDNSFPDEPVYLDLDASSSVTYGDLRLAPFDTYAAGTVVDLANRDVGRALTIASPVRFSQAGTTWVLDLDRSTTLSAGDVRFAPLPLKVPADDAKIGAALAQNSGTDVTSYGWTGGERNPTLPFYFDLDPFSRGGSQVSTGDLRITPLGFASDRHLTQADLEAAMRQASTTRTNTTTAPTPMSASSLSVPAAWRGLDWLLVGVGVLNLVGLIAIARHLNQLHGPPHNPFK